MSVVVYFFFFKQKTAYEMRISDWSSDVCSSDLATGAWPVSNLGANGVIVVGVLIISALLIALFVGVTIAGGRSHDRQNEAAGQKSEEIGRASCRERVCQYV